MDTLFFISDKSGKNRGEILQESRGIIKIGEKE